MAGIRDYAVEHWGMVPDASTEEFGALLKRQVRRGVITRDRLLEINAADKEHRAAAEADVREMFEKAGIRSETIAAYFAKNKSAPTVKQPTNTSRQLQTNDPNDTKAASMNTPNSADQSALVAKVFHGAGQPNVNAPSARYSAKRFEAKHAKTGQPVFRGNAPVELPSDREHALMGAYFRSMAVRSCPNIRPLDDHEIELLKELSNDHAWCGEVGGQYYTNVKLATALGRKGTDFIADGTSGGTSLVPYFYDTDIVTFPLLSGELFPMVDLRELGTSNQVKTQTLGNLSATWSGSEGSGSSIPLETTDGLVAQLSSNAFNVAFGITIGRDMMSDSPLAVSKEVTGRIGARLAAELDKVIAIGDGTTQPKGLSNTTGFHSISATNGSAGPFTVTDLEHMIAALPKQYRLKADGSVAWVMNDATWFRIRGIPVSTTDQRRIFGYNHEDYTLFSRPVKISNDLPVLDLFFGKLSLYRMWRRMGMQIEMSTEGKTLRTNNEMLITARGRYAGQFVDGGGLAFMANAPLH